MEANFPFEQVRQLSAPLELVYPAGHSKQDFESFAYVPSRQAWKPETAVELGADPGGIGTKLVPPTEMYLGGTCVHELEFWSVLTLPKSQSWHSDKPVSLPNFPGMHGRHEACPGLSWKNPIPQAWHAS